METFDIAFSDKEPLESISLSVDFVEFGDGSTWGIDSRNSRDMLAGQREGAKAERKRLRELLKSKGPAAVLDAAGEDVTDGTRDAGANTNRSEEWLRGYRNGVGSFRHRLRRNLQTPAASRSELELGRPFDLSAEQPE